MEPRRLATGEMEARFLTNLERHSIAVFSEQHHADLAGSAHGQARRLLVSRLARKGWLLRIERGKYAVVPRAAIGAWSEHPFVIAHGIAPEHHFISYWSALAHHGLTEQQPQVVTVAVLRRSRPPISFQHWDYRFVEVPESAFFGYREHAFPALNGAVTVHVPIADPSKAVLDSLEHEDAAGGLAEVTKALRRGFARKLVSVQELAANVERWGNAALAARAGFLVERLDLGDATPLMKLARRNGRVPALSQQDRKSEAPTDRRWRLRVNAPEWVFDPEEVG